MLNNLRVMHAREGREALHEKVLERMRIVQAAVQG